MQIQISNETRPYVMTTPATDLRANPADAEGHTQGRQGEGQSPSNPSGQGPTPPEETVGPPPAALQGGGSRLAPGGAIQRRNVPVLGADGDAINPLPMLRRRTDAYEGMMQIF